MAYRVARDSRSLIALALASLGLAACSSSTPTAPSALSNEAAPAALTASAAAPAASADEQAAGADTIKITKGTLAIPPGGAPGDIVLQGSKGFRFEGRTLRGIEPRDYCGPFNPCFPGASVPFYVTFSGGDLPGTARLQGDEFPVGFEPPSMWFEVTGSFVAPAHVTDRVTVTVPFQFNGSLFRAEPYQSWTLTGRGEVTFTFEWQPFFDAWGITYSSFDFGSGGGGPA